MPNLILPLGYTLKSNSSSFQGKTIHTKSNPLETSTAVWIVETRDSMSCTYNQKIHNNDSSKVTFWSVSQTEPPWQAKPYNKDKQFLTWYMVFNASDDDSWDIIPLEWVSNRLFIHGIVQAKIAPLQNKKVYKSPLENQLQQIHKMYIINSHLDCSIGSREFRSLSTSAEFNLATELAITCNPERNGRIKKNPTNNQ